MSFASEPKSESKSVSLAQSRAHALPTAALDYPLDPARIAVRPAEPRDSAKLMVVDRAAGTVEHAHVRDLPRWLRAGDHLVVNRTRVTRARFKAARARDGRETEGLLLEQRAGGAWHALVRHAKRFHAGDVLLLVAHDGRARGDSLELLARDGEGWLVRLRSPDGADADAAIERSGWTPLPPYIVRARAERHAEQDDDVDRAWYQTVFAQIGQGRTLSGDAAGREGVPANGSVAAPTAGLHFTPELLAAIDACGVRRLDVNLQVGAGTFKPVEAATLADHQMHAERCHVPGETLAALRAIAADRAAGRARLVVVGTTSARALESLPRPLPMMAQVASLAGESRTAALASDTLADGWFAETRLLIQPGHQFQYVDALLTNFHLPRSTLLALVGAFVGLERLKDLYAIAQAREYRFFSYGDAMLIL